ncbi:hypothetical protein GCM10023153_32260 [Ornithinibacter aureus]|uniref:DUF4235 domain-containing protein n=1 Tax=Ornithinibacter aureus TaxID=622664 RepID=A0ABP8K9J7_9MICO|nr:DUF4235 domain-containing protein [Ornithinibacter aureus]KAF0834199.1 uncharacterized protein DUF4235 [Ornithinibacter aureus]
MGPLAWKIMGTGGAVLAGLLATKVVDLIWSRAVQDDVNPKSPEAPISKAVLYAALTGLAVGAAKTLTTRKAAQFYANSAGHLPQAIREEQV